MSTDVITRKVDELGRVILPIEFRKELGIKERDDLDMRVQGSSVVLTKAV